MNTPDTDADPAIARVEDALTRLGAEHDPPPGWDQRVLAAARIRRFHAQVRLVLEVVSYLVAIAAIVAIAWACEDL